MSTGILDSIHGVYRTDSGYMSRARHREEKTKFWLFMQFMFWVASMLFGETNWKQKNTTTVVVCGVLWLVSIVTIAGATLWLF